MKIMLTGGAGFIGSHVADAYLAAGHQVVILDDLRSGDGRYVPSGTRHHVVDIACPEPLDTVVGLERPDAVCHHAAQTSVTLAARDPALDARNNCTGLLNMLQSCVRHEVTRFIFISSGGAVYGDVDQRPTPESVTPRPRSPYGIHKLAGEHYLDFYRQEYGIEYTTLRYGNVYGPRQSPYGEAGVVAIFIDKLLRKERPTMFAFTDQPEGMSRDYVYVEDVANANLLAVENGAMGVFNIAGGRAVRTRELFEEVQAACGSTLTAAAGPPRPGDLRDSWLDISRAADVLGWRPEVTLADGIRRTVEFIRSSAPEGCEAGRPS